MPDRRVQPIYPQRPQPPSTIPQPGPRVLPPLPVPMWPGAPTTAQTPPFVPGQVPQGMPQGGQEPMTAPQNQVPQGIWQKLQDPRLAGFLLSVGSALGQPRQFGQTGWGQAAQAMGQGYNYLAMAQAAQKQAQMEDWARRMEAEKLKQSQAESVSKIQATAEGTDLARKELKARVDQNEATIKFQRDHMKSVEGMNAAQLKLEGDKLTAQIQEAKDKLAEMTASRKDTTAYHNASLKLQELGIKADNVRAAAAMLGARADMTRAEKIPSQPAKGVMTDDQRAKFYRELIDQYNNQAFLKQLPMNKDGTPIESESAFVKRHMGQLEELYREGGNPMAASGQPAGAPAPAAAPAAAPAPKVAPPKKGEIRDGYRFEGGDPRDAKNYTWMGK